MTQISRYAKPFGLILLLFLGGCRQQKEENEDTPAGNIRVPVSISRITQGDIESVVSAVGNTEALRKQKILSPVTGRVISLKAMEGSVVHNGDVIVTLRTREAQSAIDGAYLLLRSATTEQQKQEAQRAVLLADSLQPQVFLRASFDGIVASRSVTEGEFVGDQAELLTLIDPSTIVFIADVPIGEVSKIHVGFSASIQCSQLSPDQIQGAVEAVSPQADPLTQSVKVRIRFHKLTEHQLHLLKANVPGTARIVTEVHRNVLLVGSQALLHDDESDIYSIVLMSRDSVAQIVPVTVGVRTGSLVEVHSDLLSAGQTVINRGQYELKDSTKVTIEQR